MIAAETIFEALLKDSFGEDLILYEEKFANSWVNKELHKARNWGPFLHNGLKWGFKGVLGVALAAIDQFIYKDQSSYLGSLIDFKKKGNGTYSLASGEQINGYWTNDYDVINATQKDKNGFIWKGAFKNLKPNGLIKVELPSSQS